MTAKLPPEHPLHRLFAGLIEQVFMTDLGVCEPRLLDYLTHILADFVHVDRIYSLRAVDGQAIRELSRIEAEAYLGPEISGTRRTLLVNRFIGDFTLFWAGVYPEHLRPRRRGPDRLREYLLQGKRSYGIAGELSEVDEEPPSQLLQRLSQEFELCVHGLQRVRRCWEHLPPNPAN